MCNYWIIKWIKILIIMDSKKKINLESESKSKQYINTEVSFSSNIKKRVNWKILREKNSHMYWKHSFENAHRNLIQLPFRFRSDLESYISPGRKIPAEIRSPETIHPPKNKTLSQDSLSLPASHSWSQLRYLLANLARIFRGYRLSFFMSHFPFNFRCFKCIAIFLCVILWFN